MGGAMEEGGQQGDYLYDPKEELVGKVIFASQLVVVEAWKGSISLAEEQWNAFWRIRPIIYSKRVTEGEKYIHNKN